MINRLVDIFKIDFDHPKYSDFHEEDIRKIKMTNYIGLITMLNMLTYVIFYLFTDAPLFNEAIKFLSLSCLVVIGVLALNLAGWHDISKILLSLLTPFFMAWVTIVIFGKEPGFHVYLFVASIIPVFLWDLRRNRFPFLIVLMIFATYAFIEFSPEFFAPKIILPEDLASFFKMTNLFVCFLAAGAAITVNQYLFNKKESQLTNQTEELKIAQAHKDMVYSIIAHDLRGPLGAFEGLTELYLTNYDDLSKEEQLEMINTIHKKSSSMKNLLENLLEWSKVKSGIINPQPSEFLLKDIVNESLAIHSELLNIKNLIFTLDFDETITMQADKHMTSAVLRNLVSNAIKFTPEKGSVTISSELNNSHISVSVQDNGCGIDSNDINKLFDITKIDLLKSKYGKKGSGLGLILCRDFIEIQGGNIAVISEEGKGSKFTFNLPITPSKSSIN